MDLIKSLKIQVWNSSLQNGKISHSVTTTQFARQNIKSNLRKAKRNKNRTKCWKCFCFVLLNPLFHRHFVFILQQPEAKRPSCPGRHHHHHHNHRAACQKHGHHGTVTGGQGQFIDPTTKSTHFSVFLVNV
jgi:hypothetical protein